MNNIMQALFNTNHELPNIWVLVGLAAITVIMSYAFNASPQHRDNTPSEPAKKPQGKKKKH